MEEKIEMYPTVKGNRLYVRISYCGKFADIALGEYMNDYDYDKNRKCLSRKCNRKKELDSKINEALSLLEEIFEIYVKRCIKFSVLDVKNTYKKRLESPLRIDEDTLFFKAFENKIESCLNNKRIKDGSIRFSTNTARNYHATMVRMKAYCSMAGIDSEKLTFSDLDYRFCNGFVDYVKKYDAEKGLKGTLATHLKNFRHIVNEAIRNKVLGASKDCILDLPRLSVLGEKKNYVLTVPQIMAIINYPAKNDKEQLYLNLFAFSYYGCGIAPVDIAYLKGVNIVDKEIVVSRWKSIGGFEAKEQRIPYSSELQAIVIEHKDKTSNNFLFPLIDQCDNESEAYNEIYRFFQSANRFFKKILSQLRDWDSSFPAFTFYDARHAYITHCYEANVPPHIIASGAGNSIAMQNKRYLHPTEQSRLDAYNRMQEYRHKQISSYGMLG